MKKILRVLSLTLQVLLILAGLGMGIISIIDGNKEIGVLLLLLSSIVFSVIGMTPDKK